jgi:hypothetical protein
LQNYIKDIVFSQWLILQACNSEIVTRPLKTNKFDKSWSSLIALLTILRFTLQSVLCRVGYKLSKVKIVHAWGVIFWSRKAYAPFILKWTLHLLCKKIETKNLHVHLHVIHACKVVLRKISFSCSVSKRTKFNAKNKAFHKIFFLFFG